jgi:hypothetical protein
MENKFKHPQKCACRKGMMCFACIFVGLAPAISNSEPECITPRATVRLYCQNMPADLAHGHEQDRSPSPTRGNLVVSISTASSTAHDYSVNFRTQWPFAST